MSNELAIASVTATVRNLLHSGGTQVTLQPPDRVQRDATSRLNLFLYQTVPNAAWRNQDMPRQTRPGELGRPPLALNLLYLLTAYGADEASGELVAHRLLGDALRSLHDHAVLHPEQIRSATSEEPALRTSDLDQQVERVTITPLTLSLEEMSKLWATFQTQYRVSAAFEASVVLIESRRPGRAPLPVLRRGADDRGVIADVGLEPVLTQIEYRGDVSRPQMPAAEVGSEVLVLGDFLPPPSEVTLIVRDPRRDRLGSDGDVVARLKPAELKGNRYRVKLEDPASAWAAGALTVEVEHQRTEPAVTPGIAPIERIRTSNAFPLLVAPRLARDGSGRPTAIVDEINGRRVLSIGLTHSLGIDRRVFLLLSSRAADRGELFQIPRLPDRLGIGEMNPAFDVTGVPPGAYRVRVRADGVDSLLMKVEPDAKSPSFDDQLVVDL